VLGNLHAQQGADGKGLHLLDSNGVERLQYANLSVQDASGNDLQASLEVNGKGSSLGSTTMVRSTLWQIDPLIQLAELTASNGTKGNLFGSSVAMSGNTVVIGAPEAKDGGNNLVGAAYVVRQARPMAGRT